MLCAGLQEHNGEYNKVQIRLRCPTGLRLSSLVMGPAGANIEGLQKVCWAHGAEVTARWWDAMNRPETSTFRGAYEYILYIFSIF